MLYLMQLTSFREKQLCKLFHCIVVKNEIFICQFETKIYCKGNNSKCTRILILWIVNFLHELFYVVKPLFSVTHNFLTYHRHTVLIALHYNNVKTICHHFLLVAIMFLHSSKKLFIGEFSNFHGTYKTETNISLKWLKSFSIESRTLYWSI